MRLVDLSDSSVISALTLFNCHLVSVGESLPGILLEMENPGLFFREEDGTEIPHYLGSQTVIPFTVLHLGLCPVYRCTRVCPEPSLVKVTKFVECLYLLFHC